MDILIRLATAPQPTGPSPYRAEFLAEQHVLPGICGLPRIIRAFAPVVR